MKRLLPLRGFLLALAVSLPALAQCPMCRTALASQGRSAADTFDRAILILLVPAVAMFGGVFLLAFRIARSAGTPESPDDPTLQAPDDPSIEVPRRP